MRFPVGQAASALARSCTESTQPARNSEPRTPTRRRQAGRTPKAPRLTGEARESVKEPNRTVVELGLGVVVYPPEVAGDPWCAVFTENGRRRFRQGRPRRSWP